MGVSLSTEAGVRSEHSWARRGKRGGGSTEREGEEEEKEEEEKGEEKMRGR